MDKPCELLVDNIQRIDCRPGDVFVITCDRQLNTVQREGIQAVWKLAMGGDVKCIVLDGGLKVGVINPEALASEEVR